MNEACTRCGAPKASDRLSVCPRCLLEADGPPIILKGNLELMDEIGHGGMGTVFRAKQLSLDRLVAVKFLPEDSASNEESQARFRREAKLLAKLNHPNIVTIHDYGVEDGSGYLVMELVEGATLTKLIPVPTNRALEIAVQVCIAMDYAHSQGVVHRDIKPSNILIDESNAIKIADFGIARLSAESDIKATDITGPGCAVGTPYYLAPEALTGQAPDPKMDIFSLGVVLYEMIQGAPPVGDFATLPGHLNTVVRKALANNPEHRYQTASALQKDLMTLATDQSNTIYLQETELHSSEQNLIPTLTSKGTPQGSWLRSFGIIALATALGVTIALLYRAGLFSESSDVVIPYSSIKSTEGSEKVVPVPSIAQELSPEKTKAIPHPKEEIVVPSPKPIKKKVTASAAPEKVKPAREAKTSGVITISPIPWATIWIDGKLVSKEGTLRGHVLPAGEHLFRFQYSPDGVDFVQFERTLEVPSEQHIKVKVDMTTKSTRLIK